MTEWLEAVIYHLPINYVAGRIGIQSGLISLTPWVRLPPLLESGDAYQFLAVNENHWFAIYSLLFFFEIRRGDAVTIDVTSLVENTPVDLSRLFMKQTGVERPCISPADA